MDNELLAAYIDHTLLKPDADAEQVRRLCREAVDHRFAAVCVNPWMARLAAAELSGSGVGVAVVIGFPLGATTALAKVFETRDALANGATELDMVMNIGALKGGDEDIARDDIAAVVRAAGEAKVKVIIETGLLTEAEKKTACRLAAEAGAAFVKTSTGFSGGGATVADVKLMKDEVAGRCRVKASGGIRDRQAALDMIAAGADRIGTSAGIAIAGGK